MNPILQALQSQSPNNVRSMMNMVRSARNPQAMLDSMIKSNPQMQEVMNYVRASGGDPRQAFYKMAQEKGVDPNQILNQLK